MLFLDIYTRSTPGILGSTPGILHFSYILRPWGSKREPSPFLLCLGGRGLSCRKFIYRTAPLIIIIHLTLLTCISFIAALLTPSICSTKQTIYVRFLGLPIRYQPFLNIKHASYSVHPKFYVLLSEFLRYRFHCYPIRQASEVLEAEKFWQRKALFILGFLRFEGASRCLL